jgi:hypothetical protein
MPRISSGMSALSRSFPRWRLPLLLPALLFVGGSPRKFHIGDNPRWADPGFDDSGWETVDLTPPANAHDADVGLTGYVPGWEAKGHPGYWGYAWYRIRLSIVAPPERRMALAGPPDVDSAYQVFLNGRLLATSGNFSGATPAAYSIQPRIFPLPRSLASAFPGGATPVLLAFRVWMGPWELPDPDGGGIHIAPVIGEAGGIAARYQVEWLETIRGYIVEVVEAFIFVMLAVMACSLLMFDRDSTYLWMALALVLTALMRANQAFFFWGQFETVHGFELITVVLLTPLALGAWTLAWRSWFQLPGRAWLHGVGLLTFLYAGAEFLERSWFHGVFPHAVNAAADFLITGVRLVFVILMALIVYGGTRRRGEVWYGLPALLLISIGQFARELSALGIPGIWFPFGTGVSLTQFAYAAFDFAFFCLLLHRLQQIARRSRQPRFGAASRTES